MSAVKWHEQTMVAVDTETTGTNPLDARIVTAAVVYLTPGQRPRPIQWLIDPGVDVPDEAAEVHGWTTDRIAATIGRPGFAIRSMADSTGKPSRQVIPADAALFEIAGHVGATIGRDQAVIVHNAAYDVTLLEAECARNAIDSLASRPGGINGVIDPMVIERAYDKYRKACYRAPGCDVDAGTHDCGGCKGGKHKCGGCGVTNRKLESLCTHYGIRFGASGAHDAAADAIAAARLGRVLMNEWPQTARLKLETLHAHQATWRREQQTSLRAFFDKVGKEHDGMCPEWPVHRACVPALVEGAA